MVASHACEGAGQQGQEEMKGLVTSHMPDAMISHLHISSHSVPQASQVGRVEWLKLRFRSQAAWFQIPDLALVSYVSCN